MRAVSLTDKQRKAHVVLSSIDLLKLFFRGYKFIISRRAICSVVESQVFLTSITWSQTACKGHYWIFNTLNSTVLKRGEMNFIADSFTMRFHNFH